MDAPGPAFLIQDPPITPKVSLPWQDTQVLPLLPIRSPACQILCTPCRSDYRRDRSQQGEVRNGAKGGGRRTGVQGICAPHGVWPP